MDVKIIMFVFCCSFLCCCSKPIEPLLERLYQVKDSEQVISLKDFTDFEWDDVVICNPGTQVSDYHYIFGNDNISFDLKKLLVFRKDNAVIKVIDLQYNPDRVPKVDFRVETNNFIILKENEANFLIQHNETSLILEHVLTESYLK